MGEEPKDIQILSEKNIEVDNSSSGNVERLANIMGGIDSGRGSVLHCIFNFAIDNSPRKVAIQAGLLLFLIFFVSPIIVTGTYYLLFMTESNVPFLLDWNSFFISAISIPVIGGIVISERSSIPSRLAALARSNTLKMNSDKARSFCDRWESNYKVINTVAMLVSLVGVVAYVLIVWNDIRMCSNVRWNSNRGVPTFAGYVWCFWQTPAAAFIAFGFLVRIVSTIFLLKDLSEYVKMEIFHPDECGGLREIGRFCFRNQIGVMVIGLNILVGVLVSLSNGNLWTVMPAAAIYIIFGPFGFLGPLTPFRKNMLQTRNRELNRVKSRLYIMHKNLLNSLDDDRHGVPQEDADAIQRVTSLLDRIKREQVWPFDASTLRRFLVAYLLPIVSAVLTTFAGDIFSYIVELTK